MRKTLVSAVCFFKLFAIVAGAKELPVIAADDFSAFLKTAILPKAIAVEGVIHFELNDETYIDYPDTNSGKTKRLRLTGIISSVVRNSIKDRLNYKNVKVGGILVFVDGESGSRSSHNLDLIFAKVLEIIPEEIHKWDEVVNYTHDRWVKIEGVLEYDPSAKKLFLIRGGEGPPNLKIEISAKEIGPKSDDQTEEPALFYGKFVPQIDETKNLIIGSLVDISDNEQRANEWLLQFMEKVAPEMSFPLSGTQFRYSDVWKSKPNFSPDPEIQLLLKE